MKLGGLLLVLALGCGSVGDAGMVDGNGCPTNATDWTGTATLLAGCSGAPQTIDVSNGTYGDAKAGSPTIAYQGLDANGMCIAMVGAMVSCGNAGYLLKMPAR